MRSIVAYGDPILQKRAKEVDRVSCPNLRQLVDDMFATMYNANGIGLAASQIGLSLRIFVIDSTPMFEKEKTDQALKQVFINAHIIEESGQVWSFEEGCLSIPDIQGEVTRKHTIKVTFIDQYWQCHTKVFSDVNARIIQHEYDHTEGVLFIKYLTPLKKRLLRKRLWDISKGKVNVDYKMRFPLL